MTPRDPAVQEDWRTISQYDQAVLTKMIQHGAAQRGVMQTKAEKDAAYLQLAAMLMVIRAAQTAGIACAPETPNSTGALLLRESIPAQVMLVPYQVGMGDRWIPHLRQWRDAAAVMVLVFSRALSDDDDGFRVRIENQQCWVRGWLARRDYGNRTRVDITHVRPLVARAQLPVERILVPKPSDADIQPSLF